MYVSRHAVGSFAGDVSYIAELDFAVSPARTWCRFSLYDSLNLKHCVGECTSPESASSYSCNPRGVWRGCTMPSLERLTLQLSLIATMWPCQRTKPAYTSLHAVHTHHGDVDERALNAR